MQLKRRNRISPSFAMASMTDVIFLLLIFFMITSTVVSPNAIKVLLPQGKSQTAARPLARVIIDAQLRYYTALGNGEEKEIEVGDLAAILRNYSVQEPEMYVALYADKKVPYSEVVHVLSIANDNHYKVVLATRPPER